MSAEAGVLIVDDAENWRKTLRAMVRRFGYGVSDVQSLREGREALAGGPYRLAIVDVRLVESDGHDTGGLTLVREAWQQRNVDRFILISAHSAAAQVRAELGDAIPYRFFEKSEVASAGFRDLLGEWLGQKTPGKPSPAQPAPPPRPEEARRPVLVIENDAAWVGVHQQILRVLGYEAEITPSYAEARGLLLRRDYDLAVVDLELACETRPQNLHGVLLLEWLAVKQIPVLVVSGHLEPQIIDAIIGEYPYIQMMDKLQFEDNRFRTYVEEATHASFRPGVIDPTHREARRKKFEELIAQVLAACDTSPQERQGLEREVRQHRNELRDYELGLRLSGPQAQELAASLLDAYDAESLQQMVRFRLDERLDSIAGGDDLSAVVFNLIAWAERTGRAAELVAKAHAYVPGNGRLAEFARSLRAPRS